MGHPPDAEPGALAVSFFFVPFSWDWHGGSGLVGTTRGTRTRAMARMPDALLRDRDRDRGRDRDR